MAQVSSNPGLLRSVSNFTIAVAGMSSVEYEIESVESPVEEEEQQSTSDTTTQSVSKKRRACSDDSIGNDKNAEEEVEAAAPAKRPRLSTIVVSTVLMPPVAVGAFARGFAQAPAE